MKVKAVVLETALTLDQHCSDGKMCCRSICIVNRSSRLGCYCETLASALSVRFVTSGDARIK